MIVQVKAKIAFRIFPKCSLKFILKKHEYSNNVAFELLKVFVPMNNVS